MPLQRRCGRYVDLDVLAGSVARRGCERDDELEHVWRDGVGGGGDAVGAGEQAEELVDEVDGEAREDQEDGAAVVQLHEEQDDQHEVVHGVEGVEEAAPYDGERAQHHQDQHRGGSDAVHVPFQHQRLAVGAFPFAVAAPCVHVVLDQHLGGIIRGVAIVGVPKHGVHNAVGDCEPEGVVSDPAMVLDGAVPGNAEHVQENRALADGQQKIPPHVHDGQDAKRFRPQLAGLP
mmetsp:Transcript_10874/g.26077  ORF Transcript_10874/g.26077 Transcript_10874/m.26077 type:complete len:232 (+) Transcript_10874:1845-2540(+)